MVATIQILLKGEIDMKDKEKEIVIELFQIIPKLDIVSKSYLLGYAQATADSNEKHD